MALATLAPFPPARDDGTPVSRMLGLRPAKQVDLPFLARLYTAWRLPELRSVPWGEADKQALLDDQFRLQHDAFVHEFPRADFWIVHDASQRALGRLYLDRSFPQWRLVDILLEEDARGQGVGTSLIRWVQHAAAESGATRLVLHVAAGNQGAESLYRRLGFAASEGGNAVHRRMIWLANGSPVQG